MLSTSTHVFSEILIHLNWHCKNDKPAINPAMEPALYEHITNYCNNSKGVRFLALGGTPTHIHLVIEIEPQVALAELVGKVKGSSSHFINQRFGRNSLEWQRGYATVSFAKRNLRALLTYVANQKEHHSKGTINSTLEQFGEKPHDG